MTLRIIYRSVGSENRKNRPPFYSKMLALASLLRAVANVSIPVSIVFLNDGEMPPERLVMMAAAGIVLPVTRGSNRASYRLALRLPRTCRWPPDDLVWFAEDDYLYCENALSELVTATTAQPRTDYFTLYGTDQLAPSSTRRAPVLDDHPTAHRDISTAGGQPWTRLASTTSTFGARAGTLHVDERLLRLIPFTGGAFDRATCLALQGYRPFPLSQLGGDPPAYGPLTPTRRVARRAALIAVRSAIDVLALTRPEPLRRTLTVPVPSLATHLENHGALAPGRNWEDEAQAVQDWLHARHPEPALAALR